jgi:hypothetical protein
MSMKIEDLQDIYVANSPSELEVILLKRYGPGVNSFWLSHNNEKHPSIGLLVTGDLAVLHYFPSEGHPGFVPAARVATLNTEETTIFSVNTVEEELEVSNQIVTLFSIALSAAKEFLVSKELPSSIKWLEL